MKEGGPKMKVIFRMCLFHSVSWNIMCRVRSLSFRLFLYMAKTFCRTGYSTYVDQGQQKIELPRRTTTLREEHRCPSSYKCTVKQRNLASGTRRENIFCTKPIRENNVPYCTRLDKTNNCLKFLCKEIIESL